METLRLSAEIRGALLRAVCFTAATAVISAAVIFAFSGFGASALFRLGVRLGTERVDTSDGAYLEYYDAKKSVLGGSGYRIFLRRDGESLAAALDFLKFVKQNDRDVAVIRMDCEPENLNEYLESGDESLLASLDDAGREFVRGVYDLNKKQPPAMRLSFAKPGDPGSGEFSLEESVWDSSKSRAGVLDVSCIYKGSDPLFSVGRELRFGSLERLSGCIERLENVSGSFGLENYAGINEPEYYFLIPESETADY